MTLLIVLLVFLVVWAGAFYYLRQVWFYRDPERIPPARKNIVVSPADGQIVYIRKFKNDKIISEKNEQPISISEITKDKLAYDCGTILGIYMSPLDVHFNYAPISGQVKEITHSQAKVNLPMVDLWEYVRLVYFRRFVNLFSKKFHFENERNTLVLQGDYRIGVVEIADKFVNKIKCFVTIGDNLQIGQKIGFIERGSQVDLILPDSKIELEVKEGQQVYGGVTVIASLLTDARADA
ncbi:MAG: phosphatidylserine decarboxylase [Actinobacteria bacterium]|nr:MAG: phosphatidylserine decarboxylase [Actinomycetota bacterium]